jgi:hypothetical protein
MSPDLLNGVSRRCLRRANIAVMNTASGQHLLPGSFDQAGTRLPAYG